MSKDEFHSPTCLENLETFAEKQALEIAHLKRALKYACEEIVKELPYIVRDKVNAADVRQRALDKTH
jgi:hypothetical protein